MGELIESSLAPKVTGRTAHRLGCIIIIISNVRCYDISFKSVIVGQTVSQAS